MYTPLQQNLLLTFATAVKDSFRDVSVSNIIVRTNNMNLNEKGCTGNADFTKMWKKKFELNKSFEKG